MHMKPNQKSLSNPIAAQRSHLPFVAVLVLCPFLAPPANSVLRRGMAAEEYPSETEQSCTQLSHCKDSSTTNLL